MDFVDECFMFYFFSQVFVERVWRDIFDGWILFFNLMFNGGNYKKKKVIDRFNQVMDYVSFIFFCIKIFYILYVKLIFKLYINYKGNIYLKIF